MESNIYLGNNKYIEWVDFDSTILKLLDLNDLREPLPKFWDYLEWNCVAACCGIEAFSFTETDILRATQYVDKADLLIELNSLKKIVLNCEEQVVMSTRLNQLFDRSVYVQLLNHLITQVSSKVE
jgi:hypothetical protein